VVVPKHRPECHNQLLLPPRPNFAHAYARTVDGGQRLHDGLAARLTSPAAGTHIDGKPLVVCRQIEIAGDLLTAQWSSRWSELQAAQELG
jgi:hypothetical protein